MTLQQLRYVTTVADTGTISRAAQQFYISQPSLTNAIRELEAGSGAGAFQDGKLCGEPDAAGISENPPGSERIHRR